MNGLLIRKSGLLPIGKAIIIRNDLPAWAGPLAEVTKHLKPGDVLVVSMADYQTLKEATHAE